MQTHTIVEKAVITVIIATIMPVTGNGWFSEGIISNIITSIIDINYSCCRWYWLYKAIITATITVMNVVVVSGFLRLKYYHNN